MPERYCHVRYGDSRVENEIYCVIQKMSSELHMSKRQIEGSILAVANILLERDWKPYKIKGVVDSKTLCSIKNIQYTEPLFVDMALCAIVHEIMSSETDAAITYSNDDSSMSGVGSYVVQSLTINGVNKSLPTLAIFTESRETLKI